MLGPHLPMSAAPPTDAVFDDSASALSILRRLLSGKHTNGAFLRVVKETRLQYAFAFIKNMPKRATRCPIVV
jgi:hypothetical protein